MCNMVDEWKLPDQAVTIYAKSLKKQKCNVFITKIIPDVHFTSIAAFR